MKSFKTTLFLILIILTCNSFSQEIKDPKGYGKLVWGSSLSTVKLNYATIVDTVDPQEENAEVYMQENPTELISLRCFYFTSGTLYKVLVAYNIEQLDENSKIALISKIAEDYGKASDAKDVNVDNGDGSIVRGTIVTWDDFEDTYIEVKSLNFYSDFSGEFLYEIFLSQFISKKLDKIRNLEIINKKKDEIDLYK